jgi:hypothetical protein
MKIKYLIFLLPFLSTINFSQNYKVIESNLNYSIVEYDFSDVFELKEIETEGIKYTRIEDKLLSLRIPGEPNLPNRILKIGLPPNSNLRIEILKNEIETFYNQLILPTPDSSNQKIQDLNFVDSIYGLNAYFPSSPIEASDPAYFRYIKFSALTISPFQYNPIERKLIFNRKFTFKISFQLDKQQNLQFEPITDKSTLNFVETELLNPEAAKNFIAKNIEITNTPTSTYWYDPNKDYYKIYLNEKGIYRVTFSDLINAGVNPNGQIRDGKLELYNLGEKVPIDIVDKDSNGVFNEGDYFQFVGFPVKPSPYSGLNIYNLSNIYWFSYQADTVYNYKYINGYPDNTFFLITSSIKKIHWEKDLLYDPFGYASNDQRDYWNWESIEVRNGIPINFFDIFIKDSIAYELDPQRRNSKLRVSLHGVTSSPCQTAHNAWVKWNFKQIGPKVSWSGQNSALIEGDFVWGIGGDSVYISPDSNYIIVGLDSLNCSGNTDIVRLNWIELEYWRLHKMRGKPYFDFVSPPNRYGANNYFLFEYPFQSMKIYIPKRAELIPNPWIRGDIDQGVYFRDTVYQQTEYFCVEPNYFLVPDSIIRDQSSDLRNLSNGADYIIITHKLFEPAAQRLKQFRDNNLSGFDSARVKLVEVQDIYDEFNYGLMEPTAIKEFIRFAFNNWQAPAPFYIVLMGDMSRDYRKIFADSRENFIPSMPFHALQSGQVASDNEFVTIIGNDFVPELSIGRISCETIDEANLLVDKIINYPGDQSKLWRKTVGLFAGGLNENDENTLRFNDRSMDLENYFVKPHGSITSKVFRYPNKPEYLPFYGSGPEIRREINKGTVISNYYGHGGGYQWDFVFNDDDIYALNNGSRLPFVVSVTCYTNHFDNQEVFAEIFNSLPYGGSIAFLGSSSLTYWPSTAFFNQEMFREIFLDKDYVIGSAILTAKTNPAYGQMLQLLSLLGDPAIKLALPEYPDFSVISSDIKINPLNPLINDTVTISVVLNNFGTSFPNDTVAVEVYKNLISDSTLIELKRITNFNLSDTLYFNWIPTEEGVIPLIVRVNEVDTIMEDDHSDNIAMANFSVFNISQPNIIKPLDFYFTNRNYVDFLILDIGDYINQQLYYSIVIDTSKSFNSQAKIQSGQLSANDGLVFWKSPQLNSGTYYWQAFIYSNTDTNFTSIKTFSVGSDAGFGFLASKNQLKEFNYNNIIYSDSLRALILNTQLLPPHPSDSTMIDSILISIPDDSTFLTATATDGNYIYFGNIIDRNFGRNSKIYKVGTGEGGTIKGFNYGSVGNLSIPIKNQMFYLNGLLYVATGDDSTLLTINPITADTARVLIPSKLLPSEDGLLENGGFHVSTDGRYVYNLTAGYGNKRNKYILRTLDPQNNWNKVGDDVEFLGASQPGFSNFFVSDGYVITIESYNNHYVRSYRLDGFFEGEWIASMRPNIFFSFARDLENNFVYLSTYKPINFPYQPAFFKFSGSYKNAFGKIESPIAGPAKVWGNLRFVFEDQNSQGVYKSILVGKKSLNQNWDTLAINLPSSIDIRNTAEGYRYIKTIFELKDSSFGASEPLKFKELKIDYTSYPELHIHPNFMTFSEDTVLQGFDINLNLLVKNIGYSDADSISLNFYLNQSDSIHFSNIISSLKVDSTFTYKTIIPTNNLLYTAPLTTNNLKVVSAIKNDEFYYFNNFVDKNFFVSRDSISPRFHITFDGREILDGDIISSEPVVMITLEDNSPLPLDTTLFTIVHNNIPLRFSNPDLSFSYTPYPNSKAEVLWTPKLKDGRHVLEVLAKDASNNFFDTTSYRQIFYVYNDPDLRQVYNYPNPFKDDTYFTFELRGVNPPEEFKIKVFTIAGRLIREINVPPSSLQIGFNKIYWDGRDQDGDEIANGLYFYKIISKQGDEIKTVTQKLAKVK